MSRGVYGYSTRHAKKAQALLRAGLLPMRDGIARSSWSHNTECRLTRSHIGIALNQTAYSVSMLRPICVCSGRRTGVRKDSATKRALAFNCVGSASCLQGLPDGLTKSFISEISLSTSSINWMIKSTSLCFNISSVWKLVMRKDMS